MILSKIVVQKKNCSRNAELKMLSHGKFECSKTCEPHANIVNEEVYVSEEVIRCYEVLNLNVDCIA